MEASRTTRSRLRYRSSPIVDFGICAGSVLYRSGRDKLVYKWSKDKEPFLKGQDPDRHYWIYFKTAMGEDLTLDCGLLPLNIPLFMNIYNYVPMPRTRENGEKLAPVLFTDSAADRTSLAIHEERNRFSVLRDLQLQSAVALSSFGFEPQQEDSIASFLTEVKGFRPTTQEVKLAAQATMMGVHDLDDLVKGRLWTTFPFAPTQCFVPDYFSAKLTAGIASRLGAKDTPEGSRLRRLRKQQLKGSLTKEEVQMYMQEIIDQAKARVLDNSGTG